MPGVTGLSRRLAIAATPSLRAGDRVEVKSKEEILATLDNLGALEGMPFMPEMLKYCGRRFKVYKRAHKTCDYSTVMQARSVPSAVHLEDLRCSGESHGGCQAECLLFWKEAWLKPVDESDSPPSQCSPGSDPDSRPLPAPGGCTEEVLEAATRISTAEEPVYSCQATCIPRFSTFLPGSDVTQYVEAYTSGNVRLSKMFAPILFRLFDRIVHSRLGATGFPQKAYDVFQRLRGGVPYPNRPGLIPIGEKTPRGEPLHLQPGDWVKVKSLKEILSTVNRDGLNRGMLFSQELVPYCGKAFRVHSRVAQIIDEKNGKMLFFKNECIILQDVICQARYNGGLSFCPRSNYPYWREIWLERLDPSQMPNEPLPSTASYSC
jgi:hypothetical protein